MWSIPESFEASMDSIDTRIAISKIADSIGARAMRMQSFSMIPALPVKSVPDTDDQGSDIFLVQIVQKVQGTLRAQELFQDRQQVLFSHVLLRINSSNIFGGKSPSIPFIKRGRL
jgi:hypothetical protein